MNFRKTLVLVVGLLFLGIAGCSDDGGQIPLPPLGGQPPLDLAARCGAAPELQITTPTLSCQAPNCFVPVAVTGGLGSYLISIQGLQGGLVSNNGVISGNVSAAGTQTLSVTATDINCMDKTVTAPVTLTIAAAAVVPPTGGGLDTDGDGVMDANDRCPRVAGPPPTGCPSGTPPTCDVLNCATGCCDGATCVTVTTPAQCGTGGAACSACTTGQTCTNGACGGSGVPQECGTSSDLRVTETLSQQQCSSNVSGCTWPVATISGGTGPFTAAFLSTAAAPVPSWLSVTVDSNRKVNITVSPAGVSPPVNYDASIQVTDACHARSPAFSFNASIISGLPITPPLQELSGSFPTCPARTIGVAKITVRARTAGRLGFTANFGADRCTIESFSFTVGQQRTFDCQLSLTNTCAMARDFSFTGDSEVIIESVKLEVGETSETTPVTIYKNPAVNKTIPLSFSAKNDAAVVVVVKTVNTDNAATPTKESLSFVFPKKLNMSSTFSTTQATSWAYWTPEGNNMTLKIGDLNTIGLTKNSITSLSSYLTFVRPVRNIAALGNILSLSPIDSRFRISFDAQDLWNPEWIYVALIRPGSKEFIEDNSCQSALYSAPNTWMGTQTYVPNPTAVQYLPNNTEFWSLSSASCPGFTDKKDTEVVEDIVSPSGN